MTVRYRARKYLRRRLGRVPDPNRDLQRSIRWRRATGRVACSIDQLGVAQQREHLPWEQGAGGASPLT